MIRAREVRVIDSDGKQLGILETSQAINRAQEKGMDLILISADASPPVCRIADFGKIRYEQTKKEKQNRKGSKAGQFKELKLSPKIGDHDFEVKVNRAKEFLLKGYKVKVTLHFRGREITHPQIGHNLMNRMTDATKAEGIAEGSAKFDGRNMILILAPKI